MTKPLSKITWRLLEDIFFLGSIFCLAPSQEDSRFIKSLAKGDFFFHPLYLEVIIWSNIISGLAYKQQYCAIENLNQEIWEGLLAENVLCSIQPLKRFQNGLFLSFIWNRRKKNHHDFMFQESKTRNAQIIKENKRNLD